MTNNTFNSLRGEKAQQQGNAAQVLFEASLRQYETLGLAKGQRNWPEVVFFGRNKVKVVGKATTDYTVFIAGGYGQRIGTPTRAAQVEVKTWDDKDTHTMGFGGKKGPQLREQWQMMMDFAPFTPTFYLALWRYKSVRDWRLYQVEAVPKLDNGLLFKREAGLAVREMPDGWPNWLEVMVV